MGTVNALPKAEMLAQLQNYRTSPPRSPFPQVGSLDANLIESFTRDVKARPEADSAAMKRAVGQEAGQLEAASKKKGTVGVALQIGAPVALFGGATGLIKAATSAAHVNWTHGHPLTSLVVALGVPSLAAVTLMVSGTRCWNKSLQLSAQADKHRTFAASIENFEKYVQDMKARQPQPAAAVATVPAQPATIS